MVEDVNYPPSIQIESYHSDVISLSNLELQLKTPILMPHKNSTTDTTKLSFPKMTMTSSTTNHSGLNKTKTMKENFDYLPPMPTKINHPDSTSLLNSEH